MVGDPRRRREKREKIEPAISACGWKAIRERSHEAIARHVVCCVVPTPNESIIYMRKDAQRGKRRDMGKRGERAEDERGERWG